MNRRKLVGARKVVSRKCTYGPLRVDCNNMRWYAGCQPSKKDYTKGDAMSEMLLDMEADKIKTP